MGPKKDEKREVVIDADRKRQIFMECHFNEVGHHLGQKKTVHRIQNKYYWLGIVKDVVDWVGVLREYGSYLLRVHLTCSAHVNVCLFFF